MLAGVVVIILASMFAIKIGGGAFKTMAALVLGTARASAYFAFRGRLVRTLRRFSI